MHLNKFWRALLPMIVLVLTIFTRHAFVLCGEVLVLSRGAVLASNGARLPCHEKLAGVAHSAVARRLPSSALMLTCSTQRAVLLARLILEFAFSTLLALCRNVQATTIERACDTGISIAALLPAIALVLPSLT